ncbi:MarR family winged helix-turn-helix transcriptional regulator [Rhodococcus pyridinivorans]|uniref:MarR family winged helix-turn-helix transcriptional regulator n=1 Tax=Rhodococcus pyridinivorans TaxID=103816 RepID=UPI002078D330|nr:MarR family transcriptional regulator [Rhodococcus pyridinivorans]USI90190.1 MarR family transcriptional regulator [Rhodococcus pyridinivorans]
MSAPPRPSSPRRSRKKFDRQVDAVMWASRALVGIAAASVAEVEDRVSIPQLRVLVLVGTRGPLSLAVVADELGVDPSNASRTVDKLIKAGLLDRRDAPDDRRKLALTLTSSGADLVQTLSDHRRDAIAAVLKRLTAAQRDDLAAAFDTFAVASGEPTVDDALTLLWPIHP